MVGIPSIQCLYRVLQGRRGPVVAAGILIADAPMRGLPRKVAPPGVPARLKVIP